MTMMKKTLLAVATTALLVMTVGCDSGTDPVLPGGGDPIDTGNGGVVGDTIDFLDEFNNGWDVDQAGTGTAKLSKDTKTSVEFQITQAANNKDDDYASITGNADSTFTDLKAVTITYSSTDTIRMALFDTTYEETGNSHRVVLDPTDGQMSTVTFAVDSFSMPWDEDTTAAVAAVENVKAITFEIEAEPDPSAAVTADVVITQLKGIFVE